MALYLCSAVTNMTIFQRNRIHGHKFLISLILFIFSMARTVTCILRIVWAAYQRDVQIAIAAMIFNNAGVLILYLVNLIFAQRILRAMHPKIGWKPALAHFFRVMYALLAATLIMVIVATVIMFYTVNQSTTRACLDCQRAAVIALFILTTIPLIMVGAAFLLPRSGTTPQPFGVGSTTFKAILLLAAACLAVTISGFKLGTTWQAPRKRMDPAWYDSRAAYYCFGFMLEIMILCLYIFGRVDKRFHVPDGSSKRKSYLAHMPKESVGVSYDA